MTRTETTLLRSETVAEGTMAFHFARPADFRFEAGQSMNLTLIDPPETDRKGNARSFSIASAPFEDELVVATRIRDTAYKRALSTMPAGGRVLLRGPAGSLTLSGTDARPAVFLAGGIGITPFLSLLRQAAHDRLARDLWLFYSNRRPEDAAFLGEVIELQQRNSRYRFVGTMTGMEPSVDRRDRTARPGPTPTPFTRSHGARLLRRRTARHGRSDAKDAYRHRRQGRRDTRGRVLWLLRELAVALYQESQRVLIATACPRPAGSVSSNSLTCRRRLGPESSERFPRDPCRS